ncbi:MAG: hypothetical protein CME34_13725 [Gordonia sp.]|jgi:hypothetical protein|nr:hypothetical protein [Gordonia sp. (in: high G+C Gram-positive bacteria)]
MSADASACRDAPARFDVPVVRASDGRRELPERTVPAVARAGARRPLVLRAVRAPVFALPAVARVLLVVDLAVVAPVFAAPFFWAPAVAFEAMRTD